MWLYILSAMSFEDTLEYIHLGTTKPMHPVQPCIRLGKWSEDSFEIAPLKKRKQLRLASLIHYACSNSSIFRTHLKTSREDKLYKCNQCNFACFGQSALSTHLKMHSGEKSNKCNQCHFAFNQVSHLRRHLQLCSEKMQLTQYMQLDSTRATYPNIPTFPDISDLIPESWPPTPDQFFWPDQ